MAIDETDQAALNGRLNWLRAGVLGANDGIVSVAAIAVGVAGATEDQAPILVAGLAALIGGAISMALGEYVSVSSQSDSQKAFLRRRIASQTEAEEAAHLVARGGVVSPWSAAGASALAFLVGGVLPLIAVLVPPPDARVWVTFVVVVVALAAAGLLSARLGGVPPLRPTLRVVIGGLLALGVTYGLGKLLGTTGIV